MSGIHPNNNRIKFPVAEPIPLPEPQIDPAELEVINRTIPRFKPERRFCFSNLKQGCYQISYKPNNRSHFHGTLRVDRGEDQVAISGDLYKHWHRFNWQVGIKPTIKPVLALSRLNRLEYFAPVLNRTIPIYSRKLYYSYLKVTQVRTSRRKCNLILTMEEHVYNSSTESFRFKHTVKAVLSRQGGLSNKYSGTLRSTSGAVLGSFSITWVSKYFRAAKLEVDTIQGAVAPQSVSVNGQTHSFRSIFKKAGWDLYVKYDQTNIPNTYTGGSVNWTNSQMHDAMLNTRRANANLDKEWLLHLLVVPENMGSGRGVMYDQIGANREGVASFSNDGYPGPNPNWGTAKDKKQRDVPSAFLRSASHEVGHGFNMMHQSLTWMGETGTDATVMTTSPGVASFVTANGGTFPDDIEFRFNAHVRHHLNHFPDIIVRPGGARWAAGHSTTVPEADLDRYWYESDELQLSVESKKMNIKLGEPLDLKLKLENKAGYIITVPEFISPEYLYSHITVINSAGERKPMPTFVMKTDSGDLSDLEVDGIKEAKTTVFWSSKGFAFNQAGKHTIEVQILWNIDGMPFGISSTLDVWVDAPVVNSDNEVASLLLDDEVGTWVMLGGAGHLDDATSRIAATVKAHPKHSACKHMIKLMKKLPSFKSEKIKKSEKDKVILN